MIKRIYHSADLHLRTYSRHTEYAEVIYQMMKVIQSDMTLHKLNPDEVMLVIVGDILHSKLEATPELQQLLADTISNFASIGFKVMLTRGNHDFNMKAPERPDMIGIAVNMMNLPNVIYLTDEQMYMVDNIEFYHYPTETIPSIKPTLKLDPNTTTSIALYHGAIDGCKTDTGQRLKSKVVDKFFDMYDMILLGDIHIPNQEFLGGKMAYPGSLIMQNHGESAHPDHGILAWDVDTCQKQFLPVHNEYGFMTVELDGDNVTFPNRVFGKPYVRLNYKNAKESQIQKVLTDLYSAFDVQEIRRTKLIDDEDKKDHIKSNVSTYNNVDAQSQVISKWLRSEGIAFLPEKVKELLEEYNKSVVPSDLNTGATLNPMSFRFGNTFSFGPNNLIDFSKLDGVVGVFAENTSGKSAFLDAWLYNQYDKFTRGNRGVHVMNNNKLTFSTEFVFELSGKYYVIRRNGDRSGSSVKVDVEFAEIDSNGTEIGRSGQDRNETNKFIRNLIGEYNYIVMTSVFSQNEALGFIEMTQGERKSMLAEFLGIGIFDQIHELAKSDMQVKNVLIKDMKSKDYPRLKQEASEQRDSIQKLITEIEPRLKELQDNISELRKMSNQLKLTLHPIRDIDIDELNKQKSQLIFDVSNLDSEILKLEDKIGDNMFDEETLYYYQDQLIKLQSELSQLDIDIAQKEKLKNEIGIIDVKLKHFNKVINNMESHEYDPNCEYCVKSPVIKDGESAKIDVALLIQQKDDISAKILDLDELKTNRTKLKNEFNNHLKSKSELDKLQREIAEFKRLIFDKQAEIKKIEDSKAKIDLEIDEYNQQKSLIEDNRNIIDQITKIEENVDDRVKNELSPLQDQLNQLKSDFFVQSDRIKRFHDDLLRLEELERQEKYIGHILNATHKNGVPLDLIANTLSTLQSEINDILSQVVDFQIKFDLNKKNIDASIYYSSSKHWPIELTSGMERFITNIAIRVALMQITTLPVANFMMIDEGFGSIDKNRFKNLGLLFDYLRDKFKFIIVVSHIDKMRDMVDHIIEIDKSTGQSKLYYD